MILYQIRNSIFKWRWRVKNIINQFVSACLTSIVIFLTFTATVGEAKIDSESMAAIWLFDEGKGKEVKDSTANGNDGKITGNPKWVGGKFGKALEFDGSTYVQVSDNPSLDIADEITIVAVVNWIKFKDAGILSKSQDGSGDGNYFLSTGCGGGPTQAKFGIISTSGHTCGPTSPVLKEDTWYHVAGVFDGKKLSIFIDGKMESEQNQGGKITTSDWPIIIGSYAGLGYKSNAIIDELAVFNVALSKDDINLLMKDGLEKTAAVSTKRKLATTWGIIKGN
ncbi:TPA: LamG domain-containing protein [Candidatus Poribacteria bacterium]|nr:LamG domain-containing protein [Candidatus Poribacteria bacterium]HIO07002.1 LamG domain-containing protein [Candidatus Poribacteria bacterium]